MKETPQFQTSTMSYGREHRFLLVTRTKEKVINKGRKNEQRQLLLFTSSELHWKKKVLYDILYIFLLYQLCNELKKIHSVLKVSCYLIFGPQRRREGTLKAHLYPFTYINLYAHFKRCYRQCSHTPATIKFNGKLNVMVI